MTHAQREMEALQKMKKSGLPVSAASDNSFYVAGAFEWWPCSGKWIRTDGMKRGFCVSTLIRSARAYVEKRN